ncbi:hypothetical protein SynBIOSE41_00899 [Synechococcus sp. BIOS-E4-1]|nr:hypothetical protein SynBIOSE41_00899 [Synechococcus sp. BIOS-E4-1]
MNAQCSLRRLSLLKLLIAPDAAYSFLSLLIKAPATAGVFLLLQSPQKDHQSAFNTWH